jgi:perosamine synthetase
VTTKIDLVRQPVIAMRNATVTPLAALYEPRFAGNRWKYLKECLGSTFVSSVGKFVDRFEVEAAAFASAKHAVAVVNGMAALHIALQTRHAQLERVAQFGVVKRTLFGRYEVAFARVHGIC